MIEAMVAAVVGVVGILGVVGLLTDSLSKSNEISDRFIATYLAAEGVEIVRGLIDENYSNVVGVPSWNGSVFPDGTTEVQLQYNVSLADFVCEVFGIAAGDPAPDGSLCERHTDRKERVTSLVLYPDESSPVIKNADGLYGYEIGGTITPFTRKITLISDSTAEFRVKITSEVAWTSRGRSSSVFMEDYAYDWRCSGEYP